MKVPAITTDSSGCNEVIKDNVNGFICARNSAEDLASKMEKILCLSADQLTEMGCNGRKIVLHKFDVRFTIEKYGQALNGMFENKIKAL